MTPNPITANAAHTRSKSELPCWALKSNFLLLTVLLALLSSGCESFVAGLAERETDHQSYYFNFEIRTPADAPDLSGIPIQLVTSNGSSGSNIEKPNRKDDHYTYYNGSFLIFRDTRRYLTLRQADQHELVYELHISKVARPTKWTAWRPADFVDFTKDTTALLMFNKLDNLVKGSAEGYPIEMHYELVKDDFSIHEAMKKTRK